MGTLYVETRKKISGTIWTIPVESFIVLHTVHCLSIKEYKTDLKIVFVESLVESQEPCVPIDASLFAPCISGSNALHEASFCKLPVFVAENNDLTTIIAGLSAVLRGIVSSCAEVRSLLGFRQTCLIACAEVSVWTRFCEVDVINSVKEVLMAKKSLHSVSVDVARLEEHLSHPPRLHNARKHRQDYAKAINSSLAEEQLPHTYAEGPYMTLADVMLLPCFDILLYRFNSATFSETLPLVSCWFRMMLQTQEILRGVEIRDKLKSVFPEVEVVNGYALPSVPKESLYKSDPRRYKPRSNKFFTNQEDVELSLAIVSEFSYKHDIKQCIQPFGFSLPLDWDSLPLDVRPEGGHLPETRQLRKGEQLGNMARAVMKLAQPGHILVDFCSGSGHLGLLLAWLLPSCHVLLLENKHLSLQRAASRISRLGLKNVQLVQSNVDYFKGKFDIGIALHACGVATDLVLQLCESAGAAFVVCPCCYGSIQNGHTVTYPRSKIFRNSSLTSKIYMVLGHCADQTHGEEDVKTKQGHQCMAAIDTDRLLHSQELGYTVHLSKMVPQTCSPKNNLLVGIPPGKVDFLAFCSLSVES